MCIYFLVDFQKHQRGSCSNQGVSNTRSCDNVTVIFKDLVVKSSPRLRPWTSTLTATAAGLAASTVNLGYAIVPSAAVQQEQRAPTRPPVQDGVVQRRRCRAL